MKHNDNISTTIDKLLSGDDRSLESDISPLQLPNQDKILRHYTLGGVKSDRDVRMYLELGDLLKLVEIAKQSKTNRVVLPKAGITLTVRQSHGGHIYETLHINSLPPIPDRVPTGVSSGVSNNTVDQWTKQGLIKPK
tara:strand:- start:833 stop:1243 length:411 start_codon:yes stop_codon:yes gene_type:complete